MWSEDDAFDRLESFRTSNDISSKGQLSVVIQVTSMAKDKPMPLNPDDLKRRKKAR